MGFNKRYFSMEGIVSYAKNSDYTSFKKYMLNPDACIFDDTKSNEFWNQFSNGNENTRLTLYKSLRNETE